MLLRLAPEIHQRIFDMQKTVNLPCISGRALRPLSQLTEPTAQRAAGLLKVHGYQYPCCLVEPDRLLVGFSINKEDIECGIVDTTAI